MVKEVQGCVVEVVALGAGERCEGAGGQAVKDVMSKFLNPSGGRFLIGWCLSCWVLGLSTGV